MKRLRPPVIKAKGSTRSERYLAKLAEKSFLNLWSYPNPFRDQKQGGRGHGREICDLLVVCGPYIIIFSDKSIFWPSGDLNAAWIKWAKRAIRNAAKQAHGAERWITKHPDRIFLDRGCKQRFPIDLPSKKERIIHRVVVANGAVQSCKEHTTNNFGSFTILPSIKGDEHWPDNPQRVKPFCIGDIDPSKPFVHIFNEFSLNVVMEELDTISDFVGYLEKKADFVRSSRLIRADGEENLLASYATHMNEDEEHDFVPQNRPLYIDGSRYTHFINDPRYIAKKKADEISYLWDRLIENFTKHMLDGTSITLGRHKFQLHENEIGVRLMALEPRLLRRSHGQAVKEVLETGAHKDMFFRMIIKPEGNKDRETAFFVFTCRYRGTSVNGNKYEEY